jgi:D-3-phosphoglycerate dehydrogenase / 2-oxoglutarate reductase
VNQKPAILITGADLAAPAIELLKDFHLVYAGKSPQADEILALCKQHNPTAILLRYGKISAEMMDAAPALKVISKHGSGTDTIDKEAATKRNIQVVAAAGANAAAVAEHALASLLACAKSTVHLNERMHSGHWDKATFKTLELNGKTIGLIGLGAIGLRFAKMCDAIGMIVIGFDPYAKNLPEYIQAVDLSTIWAQADVISLHCPLTKENKNLINKDILAKCKQGVIVVNTARGGLINEDDLLSAIHSGKVSMAGLDSFAVEPMTAPHPFYGNNKIILSPHIGGVTADAYIKMGIGAAQNILTVIEKLKVNT